jgi:hypothetical protein
MSKEPNDVKEEQDLVVKEFLAQERIDFIRETAMRLYTGPLDQSEGSAWHMARALWAAKPEDC